MRIPARMVAPPKLGALALAGLAFAGAALSVPAGAGALPQVSVRGRAVAIRGFRGTGNILGAGAAVHAEVTISGSEYFGSPDPLIGITVDLPQGTKIEPHGFPTCPRVVLESEKEPSNCPHGSSAGPPGKAEGVVQLAHERVPETTEVLPFFAPGGGLEFMVLGHTPVILEIPVFSRLVRGGLAKGYGPSFTGSVPLVETLPEAPFASVEHIVVTLGAARRSKGRTFYYGRVPEHCPRGGFRVRSEFVFAVEGNSAMPATVTVPFRAPCP